jgi:DNA topoisomerase I
MRTDSTQVASVAQHEARECITTRFGAEYLPPKSPHYVTKSKGAQEAHEAIRPTSVCRWPEALQHHLATDQFKLYRLVWQRFVASQMAPAVLDNTIVDVKAGRPGSGDMPYLFRATGSVVRFPGFFVAYREGRDEDSADEDEKGALPPLSVDEEVDLVKLWPEQHFTQPPPRYSEATLVKELEKLGIGRPSTYAPTLGTLQARYYVEKAEKKLQPTELGMVVNDLLVEHFPNIVDTAFTSQMEEELDDIASGERTWEPVIAEFYGPFAETVEKADQKIEKVRVPDQLTGEMCEKCGRPMAIKMGRFGKFIACTGFPECRNAKPILKTLGIACPKCQAEGRNGELVERKGKRGRKFWGCSLYPECDFTVSAKPLTQPCPHCGGLMTQNGRQDPKCIRCPSTEPELARSA